MKRTASYLMLVVLILFTWSSLAAQEPDTVEHSPRFVPGDGCYLSMQCMDPMRGYRDSVWLEDSNLTRIRFAEEVTIRVLAPERFHAIPSFIQGPFEQGRIKLTIESDMVPSPPKRTPGKTQVVLEACDKTGRCDTFRYLISVSAPLIFSMPIIIRNTNAQGGNNGSQTLVFGLGLTGSATSGYDPADPGRLDSHYCEYELPPAPPREVFDARWVIPPTLGTLRNIHPIDIPHTERAFPAWRGTINPDDPFDMANLPVIISWSKRDAQSSGENLRISDLSGEIYSVDMRNGQFIAGTGVQVQNTPDSVSIVINLNGLMDFKIERGLAHRILPSYPSLAIRLECSPVPSSGSVDITCALLVTGNLRLEIFDIHGERVRLLADEHASAGVRRFIWDGNDEHGRRLPAGSYYCRMTMKGDTIARPLVLVR